MTNSPIPGLTGIEHIGLTVPDIEAASRFFADVLGAETLYDVGPFESADDWMACHLAVLPRSRINKIRMLRIANDPALELFEFTAPDQSTALRKTATMAAGISPSTSKTWKQRLPR